MFHNLPNMNNMNHEPRIDSYVSFLLLDEILALKKCSFFSQLEVSHSRHRSQLHSLETLSFLEWSVISCVCQTFRTFLQISLLVFVLQFHALVLLNRISKQKFPRSDITTDLIVIINRLKYIDVLETDNKASLNFHTHVD